MNIVFKSFFIILPLFMTGCASTEFEEPQQYIKPTIKMESTTKRVVKTYPTLFNRQLTIKAEKSKIKTYKKYLQKAYDFLYTNFGPPKYKEKVNIIVHKKAIKHPTAQWYSKEKYGRKVNFSEFYMFESEIPTMVHELFHALYQTNSFIKANPDFISEGMATYVERLYKYNGSSKKVKGSLEKDIKSDNICTSFSKDFDYNLPFSIHSSRQIYYLYILGGDFFAKQNYKNPNNLIKKMLKLTKKRKLKDIIKLYKLKYFPCIRIKKKIVLEEVIIKEKEPSVFDK